MKRVRRSRRRDRCIRNCLLPSLRQLLFFFFPTQVSTERQSQEMRSYLPNRFQGFNLLSQFEPDLNLELDLGFNSTVHQSTSATSSLSSTTNSSLLTSNPSSWLSTSIFNSLVANVNKHTGLESICRNKEGWGPTSQYRDFDFTPCFQDVSLWIAPVAILALVSESRYKNMRFESMKWNQNASNNHCSLARESLGENQKRV